MAIIGLDIGGTKILGTLFDNQKKIVFKEKQDSHAKKGFDTFMKQVYLVIDIILENSSEPVKGIGIGFPGIVKGEGYVVFAPNLPVKDFDLAGHLSEKYNMLVRVGNDVNLGTYGEYCELGIDEKNVVGLFPGTGFGGGIIIDSKPYVGNGFAGEIGHIVVHKDGVKCSCGNKGCLESYASKKGILAYLRTEIKKGRKCSLKNHIKKGVLKSSKLKKAYEDGDELVLESISRFQEYFGIGIANVLNTFNPDVIIIGGGIVDAFGDELLKKTKKVAKEYCLPGVFECTKIKQSKLGDDAVIYGTYHLIVNNT